MFHSRSPLRFLAAVLAVLAVAGCASSPSQMSDAQREGVELRRYCEQNPNDLAKCVGFLGFM